MIGRVIAMAYVGAVAALTAIAFSDPVEEHWTAEIAAAVLGLPFVIPALPVIYVLGAVAWNLSDATGGGPMWPVTLTFTAIMTAVACANAELVRAVLTRRARTRSGSAPAPARPGREASSPRRPE